MRGPNANGFASQWNIVSIRISDKWRLAWEIDPGRRL